ncbi:hypothetical protein TUM4438_10770 [Shewanella sairae]|uniref:Uncharacterized protein n=1 Tax=Shewanella sairae TaxID=190310 RepID=A0ABQ4P656_9GAMM|nr:hypothetical protein [Shewanella sairae]MCL1130510.1 hypothetical protein [Shewanella sairae]GIU42962.1 hypothetical protein TUM4438_10770 [Shewanella sairae]
MSTRKWLANIKQLLRQEGICNPTISLTGKGHRKISADNLACDVFTASTPSDYRAIRNLRRQLRLSKNDVI